MPAMLFFTAAYDDRASPLHSGYSGPFQPPITYNSQAFKHVAALQHRFPDGPNPIMMRVDLNSGHYAGKVCT